MLITTLQSRVTVSDKESRVQRGSINCLGHTAVGMELQSKPCTVCLQGYRADHHLAQSSFYWFYLYHWVLLHCGGKIYWYNFPCGFPAGSGVKNLPANAGDVGSIPGSGRSPGGGNATHSSILAWGNPMDRGAQRATVHETVKDSDVT